MGKLSALLFFVCVTGSAGNRVGNGGNVVLCPNKTPELLDFYEGHENGRKILSSAVGSYAEILKARLGVLAKVAPKLSVQYAKRVESIVNEFDFKGEVTLVDAADSLHAFKPAEENCKVKQMAIRRAVYEGTKRFVVDKVAWEKMSELQKAGLILHEVIYEHFAKLGETDSRTARRLNALVFSEELDSISTGKFWLFVKDLAIPLYP